ncbi:peptidoglycan DD-metalloendopeptidase family protein [Neisseria sp. Ec49-e6-T10]|uniref:peptidoglycan DD-metalloendopeptidase family protein n=1 Tax=Neisseria sp. Ec49-e6-T10 TaxID=3140744 RepID=UPI003EB6BD1E
MKKLNKFSQTTVVKTVVPLAKKIGQSGIRYFSGGHLRLIVLATSLPFLGMVTAYAIDTQTRVDLKPVPISKIVERLAAPDAPKHDQSAYYWREEFVKPGDTLGSILNALGQDGKEAQAFIYSNPLSKDLLRLRIGQAISVFVNDQGGLTAVQFLNDDENGEKILVAIEKKGDKWQATSGELDTQTIQTVKIVPVKTSARGNLAQEGVPADVRESLNEIFSDQFQLNDLQEGDTIRLVYESFYFRGQEVATGNILAAEIVKSGQTYSGYYFAHNDQTGTYYDASGRVLSKGFDIMPVANARISSGFGMRRHPILGSFRLHSGIDYAAPSGTPVLAPSDGVIVGRETQNGYGNVVTLEHRNGMRTLYAHLSRFQTGMNIGDKVSAGKIIGYVGSTGRSTGPHLHYEVRVGGQAVDPATSALPAKTLNSEELTAFFNHYNKLDEKLAVMRFNSTQTASLN